MRKVGGGWALALGIAIALYVVHLACLAAGGPLGAYPIVHPDSLDWLTNGLRLAGVPVECTWRPPVMPLIFATLFRAHLDGLIPLVGPLSLLATTAVLLTIGRRAVGTAATFAAALYATNHFVLTHALAIGADVLAIGLGTFGWLSAAVALRENVPDYLFLAAPALVLAHLTQPWIPFLAPALLAMLCSDLRQTRALLRSPQARVAAPLGALVAVLVVALRGLAGGVFHPQTHVVYRQYLHPSLHHTGYYAWASVAAWSLPVTALAAAGSLVVATDRCGRQVALGLLGALAGPLVAFGFFYDWRDSRFVLYWTIPAMLLAGMALARQPRWTAILLAALAIASGNWACSAEPTPFATFLVWAPHRAAVMDYYTGRVRAGPCRPCRFARMLRHEIVAHRTHDSVYYDDERARLALAAAARLGPTDTLYYDPGPVIPVHRYVLENALVLAARRRVTVIDTAAGRPPPGALLLLHRDRLSQHHLAPFELIATGTHDALVQILP